MAASRLFTLSFSFLFLNSFICPAAFSTPITKESNSKTQAKVAPESPAQVYMKYHQTLIRPDSSYLLISQFLSQKSKEKAITPAQADMVMGMVRSLSPKNVAVTKQLINANKAKVFLSTTDTTPNLLGGTSPPGATKGIATFTLENGAWKLDKESWNTSVGKKNESPDPDWCLKAAGADFPRRMAAGKIHNSPFKVEQAIIEGDRLTLREGEGFFADREIEIWFHTEKPIMQDCTYTIEEDADLKGPNITMKWKEDGEKLPDSKQYFADDGVGMRLQFMKPNKDGSIPVWIVLRLPDKDKSFVEGYVDAEVKKR